MGKREDDQNKKPPSQLGGEARRDALTPEQRAEIASAAAAARWGLPKATHEGVLRIGELAFPCSNLDDEGQSRVLSEMAFMEGMGMYRSGALSTRRRGRDGGAQPPLFLAYKNLEPFISKHLTDVHKTPLKYRTLGGNVAHGIRAEAIPRVCRVWRDAARAGVLGETQKKIAAIAELIGDGLSDVGIIALVDAATGYEKTRPRRALEKILEAYIADRLLAWAKRFPDKFYEEMFRLKKWDYKGLGVTSRPGVVGKYTNDIVYDRLAPGVLEELERLNPPNEKGSRPAKHHQWLTSDVGHPALRDHLTGLIAIMKASRDWPEFLSSVKRAYPRSKDQIDIMFRED